jgi:hypothetical protein
MSFKTNYYTLLQDSVQHETSVSRTLQICVLVMSVLLIIVGNYSTGV